MNIKRALLALAALTLTPVLAWAQPATPADGTANILVQGTFADGNIETPVTLTLQCTAGTYAPAVVEVQPDGTGIFDIGAWEHVFVISNIPDIANNVCTVKVSAVAGYEVDAWCEGESEPDIDCRTFSPFPEDRPLGFCQYNDVDASDGEPGDVNICGVGLSPLPVDVEVTKVWEMFGSETADVDTEVELTLRCNSYIVDADRCRKSRKIFQLPRSCRKTITLSGADYEDLDGDYTGMGTAVFSVIPRWYSTPDDDDSASQQYTECYVEEDASDNSAVEVDNDCGNIEVAAGMGDECTITNTVFFEGIPTLSQYGMMIMALLMLGVGFVGLRRFV